MWETERFRVLSVPRFDFFAKPARNAERPAALIFGPWNLPSVAEGRGLEPGRSPDPALSFLQSKN